MPIITEESPSSSWAKIKFFWQTSQAAMAMTATSEAAGYAKENIFDTREINAWKATSVADQYLTFDAGVGHTVAVDYFALFGHNLFDCAATLAFQYSANMADWTDVFAAFQPADNKAILQEFDQIVARGFRIKLSTLAAIPWLRIGLFGLETELGYANGEWDPHGREDKAIVNVSDTGYLLGIHDKFIERQVDISFYLPDEDFWAKIDDWWAGVAMGNFVMAWETENHPSDIYLMRPKSGKWNNPYQKVAGPRRKITVGLVGRME